MQVSTWRRPVAAFLCILSFWGCSRAVEIPREEFDAAGPGQYRQPGSYRIRLEGWNEYYARRFSVTDSTVVIHELLRSDDRYKRMKHDMPITIPLQDVKSISLMEANVPATTVLIVAGLAVLGYFAWLMIALSGAALGS